MATMGAERILQRFQTEEIIPVLDENELHTVTDYLARSALREIWGAVDVRDPDEGPVTKRALLNGEANIERFLGTNGAVLAPYIDDELGYLARGLSIYVPQ